MIWRLGAAASAWLLVAAAGCAALLPYERESVESPWGSFDDARAAYEKIRPGQTSAEDLRPLGFHPDAAPNVEILTYMDVYRRFVPNDGVRLADQDPGVQQCLASREGCLAFRVRPTRLEAKRHGNFFLDFLTFRRQTETTGWRFEALLVIVEDRVAYKLWEGNPSVLSREDRIQPLGPLQNIDIPVPFLPF